MGNFLYAKGIKNSLKVTQEDVGRKEKTNNNLQFLP